MRPGSLSPVAHPRTARLSLTLHPLSVTLQTLVTLLTRVYAPGAAVTTSQGRVFYGSAAWDGSGWCLLCTRGRLHRVIYFLYPGVQPTVSGDSNITPLPCQLLIVHIWKQHFAERSCILRKVRRKNCSTPTSSWEPLFPGCKVVIKF